MDKLELLFKWFKENYPQGDSYYYKMSKRGNYVVGYYNDYPLQHGNGVEIVIKSNEIDEFLIKNNITITAQTL